MSEVNEGVGIILARTETHPEEFFGMGDQGLSGHKWRWIFAESLREVMSEPEKAAIFEGMKRIRRLEITHKAIATVMPREEEEDEYANEKVTKGLMANTYQHPVQREGKKMTINAAQAEMIKRMNGPLK